MALADTSKAIGAVSALLKSRIDTLTTINTTVGRPSDASGTFPLLNLFLYEVSFDPHLKNAPLNEGEKPPLWVVLKYILTAFLTVKDSDSEKAHEFLGAGLRALYTDDLLKLDALTSPDILKALSPNPSPLHITFDEASSDLVAKLMQGPDDKIRISACFQVRPVMITSSAPADLSLLVGVDYKNSTLADPYVGLDVIPSMGARIDELSPSGFEVGEIVTIRGTDLHLADLSVMLGTVELPVVMQQPDQLQFEIKREIINTSDISAGSHAVTVVQKLGGTGKKRKSNTLVGNLVPTLDTAVATAAAPDQVVDITGILLGANEDDTIIALYKDGQVVKMFDAFELNPPPPPPPPVPPRQGVRKLRFKAADVSPGVYNVILVVNGQQAPQGPAIELT